MTARVMEDSQDLMARMENSLMFLLSCHAVELSGSDLPRLDFCDASRSLNQKMLKILVLFGSPS